MRMKQEQDTGKTDQSPNSLLPLQQTYTQHHCLTQSLGLIVTLTHIMLDGVFTHSLTHTIIPFLATNDGAQAGTGTRTGHHVRLQGINMILRLILHFLHI